MSAANSMDRTLHAIYGTYIYTPKDSSNIASKASIDSSTAIYTDNSPEHASNLSSSTVSSNHNADTSTITAEVLKIGTSGYLPAAAIYYTPKTHFSWRSKTP